MATLNCFTLPRYLSAEVNDSHTVRVVPRRESCRRGLPGSVLALAHGRTALRRVDMKGRLTTVSLSVSVPSRLSLLRG